MNRRWIQKNPAQAEGFIRALVDATDLINRDRKRAAKDVSDLVENLDPALVEQLMTPDLMRNALPAKVNYKP